MEYLCAEGTSLIFYVGLCYGHCHWSKSGRSRNSISSKWWQETLKSTHNFKLSLNIVTEVFQSS